MLLNDDILDQIRNKKYSLRKVEPPELGPLKVVTVDGTSDATRMLTHLIERRARMEYSDSEDSEDDTLSRNFEYWNLYLFKIDYSFWNISFNNVSNNRI